MRSLLLLLSVALLSPALAAEPLRDVKYDTKHERNVLDFWPAQSAKPAPILIWFHGGGFKNGDKSQLERKNPEAIEAYHKAGYAIASCNYPFLGEGMEYRDIVDHCARAVQFIRSQSKAWNIDPTRVCCGGISAGALISQFLGYHDDFADPKSKDPIARESSRPAVVIGIMQPIGTQQFAIRYMDKGEAPLFLYSHASSKDFIHPPAMARKIYQKAKDLGIPTELYGNTKNDLPQLPKGKTRIGLQLAFCEKHLPK